MNDAVHWIGVYQELLGVKKLLLEDLDEVVADVSAEAAEELGEVDLRALAEEQHQYRRRLDFWQQRLRSLQPNCS